MLPLRRRPVPPHVAARDVLVAAWHPGTGVHNHKESVSDGVADGLAGGWNGSESLPGVRRRIVHIEIGSGSARVRIDARDDVEPALNHSRGAPGVIMRRPGTAHPTVDFGIIAEETADV